MVLYATCTMLDMDILSMCEQEDPGHIGILGPRAWCGNTFTLGGPNPSSHIWVLKELEDSYSRVWITPCSG